MPVRPYMCLSDTEGFYKTLVEVLCIATGLYDNKTHIL